MADSNMNFDRLSVNGAERSRLADAFAPRPPEPTPTLWQRIRRRVLFHVPIRLIRRDDQPASRRWILWIHLPRHTPVGCVGATPRAVLRQAWNGRAEILRVGRQTRYASISYAPSPIPEPETRHD